MKDSRHSSSTYTESLFLHVVKHNLLFCFSSFFYLAFFSWIFRIHRTAGEGGDCLLISFLLLPRASQTLRHYMGYCCRDINFINRNITNTPSDIWKFRQNYTNKEWSFFKCVLESCTVLSILVLLSFLLFCSLLFCFMHWYLSVVLIFA